MELEHFFLCPHCNADISVLVDLTEEGPQEYIEDCEVCCRPMKLMIVTGNDSLVSFDASGL